MIMEMIMEILGSTATLVIVVLVLVPASVPSVITMEEDLEIIMETLLTVTHAIAVLALVPTSVPSVKTVEAITAFIREASQKGAHKMNPKLMTKKMMKKTTSTHFRTKLALK